MRAATQNLTEREKENHSLMKPTMNERELFGIGLDKLNYAIDNTWIMVLAGLSDKIKVKTGGETRRGQASISKHSYEDDQVRIKAVRLVLNGFSHHWDTG